MQEYQNFEDVEPFPMTDPAERRPSSGGEKEPFNSNEPPQPGSRPRVIFETLSKYDWFVAVILLIVLVSMLFPLYWIVVDKDMPAEEKKRAIESIILSLVCVFIVFALVLPSSIQVRSDGSIGIKTFCYITWPFSKITDVEIETSLVPNQCRRPRYKFATALTSPRVLVLRDGQRWGVLVSPQDMEGFIKAVRSVTAATSTNRVENYPHRPSRHLASPMFHFNQLFLLCFLLCVGISSGFVTHPHHVVSLHTAKPLWGATTARRSNAPALKAETDGSDTAPRPRRRRRRTAPPEQLPSEAVEKLEIEASKQEETVPLRPRQDAPVALQVTDVRSIVGGGTGSTVEKALDTDSLSSLPSKEDILNLGGMAQPGARASPLNPVSSNAGDDSLARLLRDAKELQAQETDSGVSMDSGNEPSIPKMISSVLSTIVTVDFFVVCGFLLWFLAGIFSSYVLKDDGIQIAFNSNFETLVQPALGILMIAAIAGNFFKEDEAEE